MTQELGKINSFELVKEDGRLGVKVELVTDGSGVIDSTLMAWSPSEIEVTEHTKWREIDRAEELSKIMYKIDELMHQAKVTNMKNMQNTPVEITLENNMLKSWRILKEVL